MLCICIKEYSCEYQKCCEFDSFGNGIIGSSTGDFHVDKGKVCEYYKDKYGCYIIYGDETTPKMHYYEDNFNEYFIDIPILKDKKIEKN